MDLVTVCTLTPLQEAFQLVLFAVLSGGLPAGVLALGLESWTLRGGHCWNTSWGIPFQFALIFQVCNLALTTPLMLGSLLAVRWFGPEVVILAPLLVVSVSASALGVRSWRTLQTAVLPEMPPSIVR